jgi:hypothetical protein
MTVAEIIRAREGRNRRHIGLARATNRERIARAHPCLGGSHGYSLEYRQLAVNRYKQGDRENLGASRRSLARWRNDRLEPLDMNGNSRTLKIHGHDHFLHYFYRLVFPKATADEIRRWIFENSRFPTIYSRADISRSETNWGFSSKAGSTTANQAFLPINIFRRQQFWTAPPPLGIFGVFVGADLIFGFSI